jgi:hypothetical protein
MGRIRLILAAMAIQLLSADSGNGLHWTPPATWIRTIPTAPYTVPPAPGDKELAEVRVFYLSATQGDKGIQAAIGHWFSQFPVKLRPPKTTKSLAAGMRVTLIDVVGVFAPASRQNARRAEMKMGFRMLGAIVEGPRGPVLFQLTGPAKTVAAQEAIFQGMIKSVSAASGRFALANR